MVSVPTGEGSRRKALAGFPWGLVLTFKSLSRSEEKQGEEGGLFRGKLSMDQTQAASVTG